MIRLAELVWLFLPAYCANMAPPFMRFWHGWNPPISRRWLGAHKTVVGFALGVLVGVLVAYMQSRTAWLQEVARPWLAVGLAQGFGAMAGDSLKSFFKRRIGIAPGARWIPADQLDFIVGALALAWPWLHLSAVDLLIVLAFTFVADVIVNQVSYRLGIRETAW